MQIEKRLTQPEIFTPLYANQINPGIAARALRRRGWPRVATSDKSAKDVTRAESGRDRRDHPGARTAPEPVRQPKGRR